MFEIIMLLIAVIGLFGYIVVSLFLPDKSEKKIYRTCQSLSSEKWIYIPDSGLYLVHGDFWIAHNPKADMPFQIVNVDHVLFEFKTKEETFDALADLTEFMSCKDSTVFYYPKEEE